MLIKKCFHKIMIMVGIVQFSVVKHCNQEGIADNRIYKNGFNIKCKVGILIRKGNICLSIFHNKIVFSFSLILKI